MSTAEPSWDLFGTFLAVMQGGSLSAASRSLRIAQPTARRQIDKLEDALGVVLFTRAPNGLVPTDAARAMVPYAESMAATARALVRSTSAAREDDRGTVRLACSEVVGAEVVPRMLARFARRHPQIQIELALSNRSEDLLRREADLAVRMVRPHQAGLVARRIGALEIGLFATKRYLSRRPAPTELAGLLRGHALIGPDRDEGVLAALAHAGLATARGDYALRTDSDLAQLAAIRAGLGIGACQVPLASRGRSLQRVLPEVRFSLETWLVMHEDLRESRRVRLLFDHLVDEMRAYLG